MPIDLRTLAAPEHTAVLTMELQRGVVGDRSAIPELAAEVQRSGTIARTAALLESARRHGARVVHCTAEFRPDGVGSAANSPMLARMRKRGNHLLVGSPEAELMPELGPAPEDVVSSRLHGLSPFTGTSLDALLRNLGVRTVVATGVSVNLGVLGMCIEAVNLGYHVVLPTDAVVGVPPEYADAIIANTLALLATRTTVDELLQTWNTFS